MNAYKLTILIFFLTGKDTEFPGVVVRPIGEFRSTVDYQYQLLRCNVDLLKIIQLGLTFMNQDGDYPHGTTTWQFNFKFNLTYVRTHARPFSNCSRLPFLPLPLSLLFCLFSNPTIPSLAPYFSLSNF